MEYSIQELSRLAGVTTRILRWYDQIDLLKPSRTAESGYRYYGPAEVDRLQDILFYRALGVELTQIKECLDAPSFSRTDALRTHLATLEAEQKRIEHLIQSVKETIDAEERKVSMDDEKKFETLKKNALEEYEQFYEGEARALYGEDQVDDAKQNMMDQTLEQYQQSENLNAEILSRLERAVSGKMDADSMEGKEIVALHRRWLSDKVKDYSPALHQGLAMLYVTDARFTQYYDKRVAGCAEFLKNAILFWADQ